MLDAQVESAPKNQRRACFKVPLGRATYPAQRRYERELWSSSQFTGRRAANLNSQINGRAT
jgi:hypothetical protein